MPKKFPENMIIELLGIANHNFKKSGNSYVGECPICLQGRKTPNTQFFQDSNTWRCYSCNSSGGLKEFCQAKNIDFKDFLLNCGISKIISQKELHESRNTSSYLESADYINPDLSGELYNFLASRGISPEKIKGHIFELKQNGYVPPDVYSRRISNHKLVVPIYNPGGKLQTLKFRKFSSLEHGESKTYNKAGFSPCLIGWQNLKHIQESGSCIIVEGEMDYYTAISCGYKNVLAVPSAHYVPSKEEIDLLPENIVIVPDNDEAAASGEKLASSIYGKKRGNQTVRIAHLSSGKDLNDFLVKEVNKDQVWFCRHFDECLDRSKSNVFVPFRIASQGMHSVVNSIDKLVKEANAQGRNKPKSRVITSGQKDLDEMLNGGFRDGLTGICGAPGVGKTSLLLSIARCVAASNPDIYVVFVSLEMTSLELQSQFLAWEAGMSRRRILDNDLDAYGVDILRDCLGNNESYSRIIVNDDCRTVEDIDIFVKQVMRETSKRCIVFVDYLQQIVPENDRLDERRSLSRIAYSLKEIGNKLRIPVVVVSSTSKDQYRNSERVSDPLASFKGSGDIEYSLYVGLYFSRVPSSDLSGHSLGDSESALKVTLVKNRHGSTRDKSGDYLESSLAIDFYSGKIRKLELENTFMCV